MLTEVTTPGKGANLLGSIDSIGPAHSGWTLTFRTIFPTVIEMTHLD